MLSSDFMQYFFWMPHIFLISFSWFVPRFIFLNSFKYLQVDQKWIKSRRDN